MAKTKAPSAEDEVLKYVRTFDGPEKKADEINPMSFQSWGGFYDDDDEDNNSNEDDDAAGMIDAHTLASLGGLNDATTETSPEDEVQHLAVQAVREAVRSQEAKHRKRPSQTPAENLARDLEAPRHGRKRQRHENTEEEQAEIDEAVRRARKMARPLLAKAAADEDEADAGADSARVAKPFTQDEMMALSSFIADYCQIKDLTLNDIRERVWGRNRKRDKFWETLQQVVPYRTRASLYKHVRRAYHVFKERGKWSEEDDERLSELAKTHAGDWRFIGLQLERMPEDCRDRWRNYIKCGAQRRKNRWDEDEELSLRRAIEKLQESAPDAPINWTRVSELMGGTRSRIQCRYKWGKLKLRDAAARARSMNSATRVWMLQRLQAMYREHGGVDWDQLAREYKGRHKWTSSDFEKCFDLLAGSDKRPMPEIVDALLDGYNY